MEGTWLRLAGKVLGGVISLYAPSRRGLISIVALRARGSALRRSMGRLCGVRFHIPGEGCPLVLAALRARRFRHPAKLGRLCGAQQGGAGYGAVPANLMPNPQRGVWAAIGGMAAGRKGTDISR